VSDMYADTCPMTWVNVKFWTGNQTEVLFSPFHIPHVPNLIKSKTDGQKIKVVKYRKQICI
jgi:hypothetical protein